MHNKKVVTRMAPSPTGKFHIGGVRTTLFNYLWARHNNGVFIIRSEDTDKERSKPEYEQNMLDTLNWLGIDFDEFYRQSERNSIYQEHIKKLIKNGFAYEAENSKDDSTKKVIRFKNPNKKIVFNDLILGEISFDTKELGDFVIARNIETPIYHLTVVVDDGLMGITHILRGQEHINNTPRQILILEALGFERPLYAHIPLIMSPRGGKLSKRDPEVIPAFDYKDQGILPEALLNFIAFIGWNPGDEREFLSLNELINEFDINKIQKSGGAFNIEKLHWINKHYLNQKNINEFKKYLELSMNNFMKIPFFDEKIFEKIIPIIRERIQSIVDFNNLIENKELNYYFSCPNYTDPEKIIWKKSDKKNTIRHLEKIKELINDYHKKWNKDLLREIIFPYAEQEGKGDVLWPLRYSLSGKDKSPDPFTLLEILGKDECLYRIKKSISILKI